MTRSWHVAALSLALLLLAGAAATAAEIDAKRLMNADKEAGNFCDHFRPAVRTGARATPGDARSRLEALFKKR